jgi:hypothetical protein
MTYLAVFFHLAGAVMAMGDLRDEPRHHRSSWLIDGAVVIIWPFAVIVGSLLFWRKR